MRILVVDDIVTNRYLLLEQIKSTGHEVVMAENGARAIEILEKEEIHLVFMDIEMPVMNGFETIEHIRYKFLSPLNSLPVIALTAHNPELFPEDFENAGFDELLTKPYSVDKLKAVISSYT